jgi:hypothetical protein
VKREKEGGSKGITGVMEKWGEKKERRGEKG